MFSIAQGKIKHIIKTIENVSLWLVQSHSILDALSACQNDVELFYVFCLALCHRIEPCGRR